MASKKVYEWSCDRCGKSGKVDERTLQDIPLISIDNAVSIPHDLRQQADANPAADAQWCLECALATGAAIPPRPPKVFGQPEPTAPKRPTLEGLLREMVATAVEDELDDRGVG